MKLHEIEEFEQTLSREQLNEFHRIYQDVTYDLTARRGYDSEFMYSAFYDMNIRTAVYLGYLIGLQKDKK